MKEVDIFGIKIKDYPLKESLKLTRTFLHDPGAHSVAYISREVLMSVADVPMQRQWIEDIDLKLFAEPVQTTGKNKITAVSHDGKSDDYLNTVLHNIKVSGDSIYLIADTEDNLSAFKKVLLELQDGLKFSGSRIFDMDTRDDMYNEINYITPNVVFACLPWSIQGPVMLEAKRILNISVWLGFLPDFLRGDKTKGFFGNVEWFDQIKFLMKLHKYNKK